MRKVIKIGFPILCVVIIIGTFYLLNKLEKKVEGSIEQSAEEGEETNTNIQSTNEAENITGNVTENVVENEVTYSTPIREDEEVQNEKNKNEQEAFKIAKDTFGEESDNYYYTNEGMEDNKYIVAIRYKDTTKVRIYYIVDLENKTAEIYY